MNCLPIESALDSDLRGSLRALVRAAKGARGLARSTRKSEVVVPSGVIHKVQLVAMNESLLAQLRPSPSADKS